MCYLNRGVFIVCLNSNVFDSVTSRIVPKKSHENLAMSNNDERKWFQTLYFKLLVICFTITPQNIAIKEIICCKKRFLCARVLERLILLTPIEIQKWHPLTFINACWMFTEAKQWMWAQWGRGRCASAVSTATVGQLHWCRFLQAEHAGSCSLPVKMQS